MNFNTNFRQCCCRPNNCCWQNPCRPMPRPPKCGCHNHCGNPCCRDRNWKDCRQNWGRNNNRFEEEFENNFDNFNYYPEDFGTQGEQFEQFERFDDYENFDQQYQNVDRKNFNNHCHNNNSCANCCMPRNAICLLAGCILGKVCR